ncbi:MAG: 6-phosphogluconolactonase [Paludibacter sp.]|nr:6-phosphogluconolactonase [Paludibacter sp.]
MNYITTVVDDSTAVADAIAQLIRDKTLSKSRQDLPFNLAVSGGSTPKTLFQVLAQDEYRNTIPWQSVRLFWVDERCVPPTDAESNFGMTYDALLQYAFIPSSSIFRMKGEDVPEDEARRYADQLHKLLPVKDGVPVFDLILLGMGDDGHTASIFPDQMHLLHTGKDVAIATHPVSGQKRITLTGKVINATEQLIFMITGKGKAEIVATIVGQQEGAKKFPASYVHDKTGNTEFYLDKEAAAYLPAISIVS